MNDMLGPLVTDGLVASGVLGTAAFVRRRLHPGSAQIRRGGTALSGEDVGSGRAWKV